MHATSVVILISFACMNVAHANIFNQIPALLQVELISHDRHKSSRWVIRDERHHTPQKLKQSNTQFPPHH